MTDEEKYHVALSALLEIKDVLKYHRDDDYILDDIDRSVRKAFKILKDK